MGIAGLKILLVVGGGIAAYKACELARLIRKAGGDVTCVITAGGQQFVTPMALAALTENQVYTDLWDLKDEAQMGHIQLSREADLVVVCPATANLIAKMTTLNMDRPSMVWPVTEIPQHSCFCTRAVCIPPHQRPHPTPCWTDRVSKMCSWLEMWCCT